MIKILQQIFGGKPAEPKTSDSVYYNDFEIRPAPVKESNGWRVSGIVAKEIDGTSKEHEFVRADSCPDREAAVALTVRKARQLIDEQGERIFHSK